MTGKDLKPLPNLIKARNEIGYTQEQLAKKSKVSRPLLCNIERGYALPSLPVAYRIAKVLKKPIEHLFFNDNVQKLNKSA
ncbi:helix-turn-helix domain-containing protein [Paenibacillus sp. FSL R7-0333]|uniref:helix-turn-helix domain-containing protein n=1 Tax=Paenibacillus sp. FSL R7-0333 TaxID=1926587 RepID=UPI0009F88BAB